MLALRRAATPANLWLCNPSNQSQFGLKLLLHGGIFLAQSDTLVTKFVDASINLPTAMLFFGMDCFHPRHTSEWK